MTKILSTICLVIAAIPPVMAQDVEELFGDISDRAYVDQICKALQKPEIRTALSGAHALAYQMKEHGAKGEFSAQYLIGSLKSWLPVEIPEQWGRLITESLCAEHPLTKLKMSDDRYHYISGAIVGPAGVFPAPDGFLARKSPIFWGQTTKVFCAVGIQEYGLTKLLVYDVNRKFLVRDIALSCTEVRNNSGREPEPIGDDAFVYIRFTNNPNEAYIFYNIGSDFGIDLILMKTSETHIVFHSADSIPR